MCTFDGRRNKKNIIEFYDKKCKDETLLDIPYRVGVANDVNHDDDDNEGTDEVDEESVMERREESVVKKDK